MFTRTREIGTLFITTFKTAYKATYEAQMEEYRIKKMQNNIGPYVPASIPVQVWA